MAKPVDVPRWADVSGDIVVPIDGKKDVGWVEEERPPNSFVNWFWNLVFQWTDWLNDTFDDSGLSKVERTLNLGATQGDAGLVSWALLVSQGASANAWVTPGLNDIVSFSIPLKIGDRIKSVSAFVRDTTGANTVGFELRKSTSVNANTIVGARQTSAGDGTNQTLTVGSLTSVIADGEFYTATIQSDSATVTTHHVYGVKVVYDRV